MTTHNAVSEQSTQSKQDRWIPSACSLCYGQCSILAHNVDGTIVKIEGNPDSACGEGRLCGKGATGMMLLYDPNRVNVPLKRTNPVKGIGVDPQWVEISWDEALEIAVKKLKKVHAHDPRELWCQGTTTCAMENIAGFSTFANAFGTDTRWAAGGGVHCGMGAHQLGGIMHASWSLVPDFKHCNYALYFGTSKGHSAGHAANQNAQLAADARARGMKTVVIDPLCNFASAKASEWVPIRVGTDGALALAMGNLLVNEFDLYDRKYLKQCTNAPYLVGPEGHYVRDAATNKPLVWDEKASAPAPFDAQNFDDFALLGNFTVHGVPAQPGFQILKEHLKKYTPEYSSNITTIPATTIRRLAKEFGEEARIGSTIVIDGQEFPYRPVAAIFFRGSQGHKNSQWNCVAIELLNQFVGCADNVGGALGFNPVCHGHPESGRPFYVPYASSDGLMITGTWMHPGHKPFPASEAKVPTDLGMKELFAGTLGSPFLVSADREGWWSKFGIKRRPKAMINFGANAIMSVGNSELVAEALKDVFVISFDIFLNEMTDFADLVLPDTCYLERLYPAPNYPFLLNHPSSEGNWSWAIRQPAVAPGGQRRDYLRVLYEIADRLGLCGQVNSAYNALFEIQDPYKLEPDERYSFEEITDRILRSMFGAGRGLEWFKEHGVMTWPKRAEEVYWRSRLPVRVPIYFEMFLTTGEQVRAIAREYGIEQELNYNSYAAVPDWNPCPTHECKDPQYDLISFYYRDTVHTNSMTMENPWLDEAAQMNDYSYNICVNAEAAKTKGLKDGDLIWVESVHRRKVKGKLKTIQGIHPEGVAIAALAGHWSKDMPVARGKGVFYNELIEIDYEHCDPGNLNMDLCAKVRIYKA
jgi:molybdopterin-containing oxidoreductase family molybdopterin binding subunit